MNSIHRELGSVLEANGAGAGMHLTVTLPKGYRDRVITERAAREQLWLWPLSVTYIGAASRQGFILGFGGVRKSEIADAVRRLRSVITSRRTQ
jgi:GntR family transcriptional regulator / MocR family aminotransferase